MAFVNKIVFLLQLIILLFVNSFNLKAQQYNFKTYTVDDGLALSQILCIAQDKKGFIWIGTNGGGVSRFDGNNFVNYTVDNGLPSNVVWDIIEDYKGNIWFATERGASAYNGNTFQTFSKANGLVNEIVLSLFEDASRRIWFGTQAGISSYDGDRFKNITKHDGLKDFAIWGIQQDNQGNMWFGTRGGGVAVYNGVSIKNYTADEGLPHNVISKLRKDKSGNIWAATYGKGIFWFKPEREKEIQFNNICEKDGLASDLIWAASPDSRGDIWIAAWGGGVSKLSIDWNADGSKKYSFKNFTKKNSPINSNVYDIIEDAEGNHWFATYGGGISVYRGNTFEIYTEKDGIGDNFIWAIEEDKKGNLWIGTNMSGISVINNGKIIKTYTTKDGLISDHIRAIYEDSRENIWVGTEEGLMRLDFVEGTMKIIKYNHSGELSGEAVRFIYEDSQRNLWFGTINSGVCKFDGYKFEFYSLKNGLSSNAVYSVHQDKKGTIWVGTEGGISRFNPGGSETDKFKSYNKDDGLAGNDVRTILEDAEGRLWLGTGGGISIFNTSEITFRTINYLDGLGSDRIYLMTFDNAGNLWIGTNIGIDKLDITEFKRTLGKFDASQNMINKKGVIIVKNYGHSDGFSEIETNTNAVTVDKNDNIWFGTVGGLVKYNPAEEKKTLPLLKTYITNAILFTEQTAFKEGTALNHEQNKIKFNYTSVCYSSFDKIKYRYKLDGLDYNWSPATKETGITYSNLPPGEYNFLVSASYNGQDNFSVQPASFSFSIVPPFWQTWWFYTLCIIAFISIMYMIITIRMKNLSNAAIILQEQVDIKTKELRKEKEKAEEHSAELEKVSNKLWKTSLIMQKEKEKIDEQSRVIAKKNIDITGSIRYAERIQKAILPVNDKMKELWPESFILYKPKDILSGDFCWFARQNGRVVVAAVDCTGHGVPGAFMSLIGNDILNRVIIENEVADPGLALKKIHNGIVSALKRDRGEDDAEDGMDIALCYLDTEHNTLEFAAAGRPVVLVRNKKLEVIAGSMFSLGFVFGNKEDYETKKIKLDKNDMIYIFTDGYCDQFGGANGEKFMSDRFYKLLLSIHDKNMTEQQQALGTKIEGWKNGAPQVDDILVVGIRI